MTRKEKVSGDKTCFIITPISSGGSDIRRHAEGIIDAVIEPVLRERGYTTTVSHRVSSAGSINKAIISSVVDSDLVIANLTSLNANVMYELAIRHAYRKPVIMICELGTKLPFDLVEQRTIFYINDMQGTVELVNDLKSFIDGIDPDAPVSNPIVDAKVSELMISDTNPNESQILYSKMEDMERLISRLIDEQHRSVVSNRDYIRFGSTRNSPIDDRSYALKIEKMVMNELEELAIRKNTDEPVEIYDLISRVESGHAYKNGNIKELNFVREIIDKVYTRYIHEYKKRKDFSSET
ncbi:hypothetical protein HCB27_05070 [Listeria booriae]|uniref:Nucleoside 2-deoxyribosyltransferase n=1 Tax=Listeria booriae TaxID=1552123 RepID=A0A7X1D7U9_9LIST|nr:hypothetical protein [Listeria booriae]MBC2175975.1 hypothetical protein [Listeria booriae]